ncbi:MAG: NapC/NirT family cytochrome c [Ignavibacteria bacterium]|nr:NapC/NirT family cytochrome c [Ignavibacteria bacterium]MDP3830611.1 NapC/NirT family cytochrome c [Ignavibacteriaceae bacterium]
MKKKFPLAFYNPITLVGAVLASVSFGIILLLTAIELTTEHSKPYMGIITFVILPGFLMFGLLLIAFGIYREHVLKLAGKSIQRKFPVIDLNDPKHRISAAVFTVGTILLLVFSAFGSFKAYEYTDSDEFCGTVCHTVMEPEYVAYLNSAHSRVGCAKCHIGSGADWFVKAKISGSYQVYSVLFNKFPRPIPTPIENLRPAQETCEQCHWPKHFFGEKKVDYVYYLSDENNTKSYLTMLLKTGGGNIELGNASGIHYHMNIANEIKYYTGDHSRTEIPYIEATNLKGEVTVYKDKNAKFDVSKLNRDELRKMDCIDCHNRPAHIYNQPDKMVNLYMSSSRIDESLPFIKSVAVQALEIPYSKKEIAQDSIRLFINNFYALNYPELVKTKSEEIKKAIEEVKLIYSRNYFPEMQVSWRRYPVNLGHTYSNGCFRCHDGNHVSDNGKVISNDCNVCHTILHQELPVEGKLLSFEGMNFVHPVDLGSSIEKQLCIDCHGANKKNN